MAGCDSCAPTADAVEPGLRRVLWIALVANFVMFGVELAASYLGDSMSLQADALDFFGDAANYGITLFVVGLSLAARAKATLIKAATMTAFGCWVLGSAVHRAVVGSEPEPEVMGSIAVLALAVNVAVAVLLYRFRSGDSNLRSIWLCSRNDAIGNIAVLAAAGGVFATASRWPDLMVAVAIAALNISAAVHVIRLAAGELRHAKPDEHPVTVT
jgi:cation diffusion facilitator family transporter